MCASRARSRRGVQSAAAAWPPPAATVRPARADPGASRSHRRHAVLSGLPAARLRTPGGERRCLLRNEPLRVCGSATTPPRARPRRMNDDSAIIRRTLDRASGPVDQPMGRPRPGIRGSRAGASSTGSYPRRYSRTNGLVCRSRPMVVSGPCPGCTIDASPSGNSTPVIERISSV